MIQKHPADSRFPAADKYSRNRLMGTMAYFHSTKTCRLIGDLRLAVGAYVKSCGYVSLCFSPV